MEFFLTIGIIGLVAAALSGAIAVPIGRLQKPYARPAAVVLGLVLFALLSSAGFVLLIVLSARAGHPF